jgi:hypothetical protein
MPGDINPGQPSLFNWGTKVLPDIPKVIADAAARLKKEEENVRKIIGALNQVASIGEDELPASAVVTSAIRDIEATLNRLPEVSAGVARAADAAEALYPLYQREHETDQARFDGERGSHAQEKQADVAAGEQDT